MKSHQDDTIAAVNPTESSPQSDDCYSDTHLDNQKPTSIDDQPCDTKQQASQQQEQQQHATDGGSTGGSAKQSKGKGRQRGSLTGTNQNVKQHMKVPPTKKDNRKLFVGGLPTGVDDEEFKDFFGQFGTVIDSVVMIDRDTKRSRGFGFVTFEDPEEARLVLTFGNEGKETPPEGHRVGKIFIRGKSCEVKVSEPKASSSTGYSPINSYPQNKGNRNGPGNKQRHEHNQNKFLNYHTAMNLATRNRSDEGFAYGYPEYSFQHGQMVIPQYYSQYYPQMNTYAPTNQSVPNHMMHGYNYPTYVDYSLHSIYPQQEMVVYDDQSLMNQDGMSSYDVSSMPDESSNGFH